MGMRVITGQVEIFVFEIEDVFYVRIYFHPGKRTRFAGKLKLYLFEVIAIDMSIPQRMNEISGYKSCRLCHHL